ncbi:hypothetical protein HPB47_002423 [Ixodes persulcatus]|uniref:Uncharacterized protein n=1 Tax=Ixodes persulcatus TaxID=34615 RepID=A0AC60PL88_IXOPE|nr:hypothetical protein HPB47_002423 [Ixodes persulcatus]
MSHVVFRLAMTSGARSRKPPWNFRLARLACDDLIGQFDGSNIALSNFHHGGSPAKTEEEHIILFLRNFRLARLACDDLIGQFDGSNFALSNFHHGGSPAKTEEEHIILFLRYVSNKSSMRECALLFNMADSTQMAVIDRVLKFLCTIAPGIIYFAVDKDALAKD